VRDIVISELCDGMLLLLLLLESGEGKGGRGLMLWCLNSAALRWGI